MKPTPSRARGKRPKNIGLKLHLLIDRLREIRHAYINKHGVEPKVWDILEPQGDKSYDILLCSKIYKEKDMHNVRTGLGPHQTYKLRIP